MSCILTKERRKEEAAGSNPTALVIGGAGFVGTQLCTELQKRGYHVKCLDCNYKNRLNMMQQLEIETFHSDVLDALEVYKATKNCDVVFHLAVICLPQTFKEPHYSLDVATKGTLNVLYAAHKNNAFFVYVSSSEVYGDGGVPMAETQLFKPTTLYGAGKASGELVTEAYARMNHLRDRYLIIRPTNCYGPYAREDKHATIITRLLRSMVLDEEMTVYGDGKQTRDFMHVADTVDGIITAYENREKLALHPTVNICTGKETSINKLTELCWDAVNSEHGPPMGSIIYDEKPRKGDVRRMWLSPWYAEQMLGWKSKIELKEGLRDYTRFLVKEHGN